MEDLIKRGEAKYMADYLGLKSEQTITSWCRKPQSEDPKQTGRTSPVGKVIKLIDYFHEYDENSDRAHLLAGYISHRAGGVHIPLPGSNKEPTADLLQNLSDILKETSESVNETNKCWFDDKTPGRFTHSEKERAIKEHLDAVQAHMEIINLIERS